MTEAALEICPKLTPTQALLLRAATRRAEGRVIPPDNLRGGARVKAMTGLMRREWIEAGDGGYVLTDAGYAVAGRKRPAPPEAKGIQEMDTPDDLQLLDGILVRPGTKLAALVVALCRPQGATNLQLMLATGWHPIGRFAAEPLEELVLAQVHAALQAPERIQDVWDAVRAHSSGLTEPEVVLPMNGVRHRAGLRS